ncbi:putative disease resistance protein [Dissostichus eleginoides]|uniref:Disease resistance protein n=1 Tax=Dissostichus eleginoides TaxID=100907 RepID=A0AAD9C763_DISEL|nr:putative disease resistance protein [Dissostichus eleginoides]
MSNPPATKACDIFTRGRNFGTKLDNIDTRLTVVATSMAALESKTDDLENRGRRKNLRLFGIREGAEGQQTLLNFVNDILTGCLELTPDRALTLERVHRTLASGKPNQHRAVIVHFLKFQEKEFVTLFVDINAFRGFQHNPCKLRVLHNGKINLFTTPQEAEKFYKSIQQ